MKDKIEQLARGEFLYELPTILLSDEELSITIETGSTFQGCFTISNSRHSSMKGVLYSSNRFLTLDANSFHGEENRIHYHFNSIYYNAGETVTGRVSIVCDCGEITLPFQAKIEAPTCNTTIGRIKDMFQFTNLANCDWLEAKSLFRKTEFSNILGYYDKKHCLVYEALMKSSKTSQAMDEFLVALHKKIEVKLNSDKTNYEYESAQLNFMDKVTLTKEGWGYLEMRCSTDASFIELERKILWADNFINNSYDLNFVVKAEEMKAGIHYGKIFIRTIHQTIAIQVKVVCKERSEERLQNRKDKQLLVQLTKNYLDFRLNILSVTKYAVEAEKVITALKTDNHNSIYLSLYQIHIAIISGKDAKAREYIDILEKKVGENKEVDFVSSGVLQYLKVLLNKSDESIEKTREFVRELYENKSEAWILLWCLLYLEKSYEYNKTQKYEDIKKQCINHCFTPILYYEAAFLLNENPALLKSLERFEQQVLIFALKKEYITKELGRQVAYLAVKIKERTPLLYQILKLIYDKFKLKEALVAICTNLIRDHQMSKKAFTWYYLGMVEQLRITELPEYYIYSMNEKNYDMIHPSVLTYFAYNNNMKDRKKAFFYANIIKHKENDAVTYRTYEKFIYEYAISKLGFGSINEHLAIIYDDIFHNIQLTGEMAGLLPEIAFYYQLECYNPNIKKVAVIHKELKNESIYNLSEGVAFIEILTDNYEVLLIDEQNQRYHTTVDYTIYKLCHFDDLFARCYELNSSNTKLLIHMSSKVQIYQKFDPASVELRRKVVDLGHVTEMLRREYIQTLIFYYYENYESDILEGYLMQCDLHAMDRESRNRIIEIMILRDLHDNAYEAMQEFGYEGLDLKRLLRFCSGVIRNEDAKIVESDMFTGLCYYVYFKGKYDDIILRYLVAHYFGTTEEMYKLWRAAKDFEVDTVELEERLISQMLFAESFLGYAVPVFMSYFRTGFNRKLIRAFLSYYSYRFLVKNRVSEAELFDVIKREAGYEGNDIYLLALLKNYSLKYELTDSEIHFADYHLNQFEQKNIVLPFFKDFSKSMQIPLSIYDKYYVEYRTNPKNKVFIHYLLEGSDEKSQFVTEEMKNVCYGIYVKEFILFQNESLQYYITEESEFSSNITESTEISIPFENLSMEENKFHLLNMILTAKEMKDEVTLNNLLEQYIRMDYVITKLFHPILWRL